MPRKLALKRLTASDLTLFKWHYQNRPAGGQKGFNLDGRLLVGALYPQLGGGTGVPHPRYRVDLYLYGPELAQEHYLVRKILRQQKNWRLNGEVIDNPESEPDRYNDLTEGDFALMEFSGGTNPSTVKVCLLAKNKAADAALYAEFAKLHSTGSMRLLKEAEITKILLQAGPEKAHPLFDWVEGDALEDAVLGGAAGIARISARRSGKGLTPEEFILSRQLAEETGLLGEEFLNGLQALTRYLLMTFL